MVRLTDRPDMALDVYRWRKTTTQHKQQIATCLVISGIMVLLVSFRVRIENYSIRFSFNHSKYPDY